MKTETAKPVRLADYRPYDYVIESVDLDIALNPHKTKVTAKLTVSRRPNTPAGTPLTLDGDGLVLSGLRLNGEILTEDNYSSSPSALTLLSPPEAPFVVEIETEFDPSANTQLMGLYRSNGIYCTQCEAEGFRRITYFADRPDVLAVYTTRIEAAKADAPLLLGNGNLVDSGELDGHRHFAVWQDPHPKPSYLFAMVAGALGVVTDRFETMSGRMVDLKIFVEPGKEDRCSYAMDALKRSMHWDEKAFGREYDLDIFMIVAVSDFNMGAMENKGLNIFNDRYILANPQTATDQDYANIEAIIAHEYFHNWTGNRITCRDWFQLCLKEGLTVFRDQEFTSDQRSGPVKRISDVRLLKSHQFAEDAGPLAHPVRPSKYNEINNFYTVTVYEKGAEVVRMLQTVVGADKFRDGMDLFFDRYDGQAVTVDDYLSCFAEVSGLDADGFSLWYEQAGTPALTVAGHYDASQKTYSLMFEQSCAPTPGQPSKKPMHIPVRFGLVGPDGTDLAYKTVDGAPVRGDVIHITKAKHTVTFTGVGARPIPSLLRGFSAPVKLVIDLTSGQHRFLIRHDSDPFNRWQSIQTLAMSLLVSATQAVRDRAPVRIDRQFVKALAAVTDNDDLDPAFRALALHLPSETDIAREIGIDVDPDAVATARNAIRAAVAKELRNSFAALYDGCISGGPYEPTTEAAGKRALRNVALDYLALLDGGATRAMGHYRQADNMTDQLAALTTLVITGAEDAEDALDDFFTRFEDDPLVIDKWLSVQASAPFRSALERIKTLTSHRRFSFSNPNRVRSLIGVFATGNPTQFNRSDGAGYDFVTGIVLKIDKKNPQVAARLLSSFRSWRSLEPGRQRSAEAALLKVSETEGLSPDVADIVSRCLS